MTIGGGSYFRGWASMQQPLNDKSGTVGSPEVLIGHVLDVNYDVDPGKIRVRLMGLSKEVNDDDISIEAYPSDINQLKYPLPGEIVLVVQGVRNLFANNKVIAAYYYITTLTSNQSITFNSDPFIGQTIPANQADKIITPEYIHRFEAKLNSGDSFIQAGTENVTVKEKSPLKPYEGDMILQGRFGSTIRLGSTSANKNDNQWSEKGGAPGNPITIISANRAPGRTLVTEDVNKNDSTVYIATSQTVPIEMFTSAELRTHLYKYDIKNTAGDYIAAVNDLTSFVESPEEETILFTVTGMASDLSEIPDISARASDSFYRLSGKLAEIVNSIPDSVLDPIPQPSSGAYLNNKKQALSLILVDGLPVEKTTGKALLALKKAAAEVGISIQLGSGYRPQFGSSFTAKSSNGFVVTFTTQESLRRDRSRWKMSERAKYNSDNDFIFKADARAFRPQTAPPGLSKHGDGIAVDVSTGSRVSFDRVLYVDNYIWMIKNSWKFGFVRTVSTEEWHFEYQPEMALKGPYGGIQQALTNKNKRNEFLFYKDLGLDNLA